MRKLIGRDWLSPTHAWENYMEKYVRSYPNIKRVKRSVLYEVGVAVVLMIGATGLVTLMVYSIPV